MDNTVLYIFFQGDIMKQFGYRDYISQSKVGKHLLKSLREGKLEGTQCTKCNILYYPPRAYCKECLSDNDIESFTFSGEGTILSFSEIHVPPAGFEKYAPYTVCLVDLKEGGRLVAWIDSGSDPIKIGDPVQVIPEVIEGDRVVYKVTRGDSLSSTSEEAISSEEIDIKSRRLQDKVSIITGAGKGIGREIALEYAREGAIVVVAARTLSDIETVADEILKKGGKAFPITCDVANVQSVQELVEKVVINVNLTGTFNCIRALTSHLMTKKPLGGKIINFTSTAAKFGNVGQSAYAASKWGIIALSKTAARELARYKTNVNCIMPGYIETAMTADTPAVYKEQTIEQIPQLRIGYPGDVAKVAVFLGSSDSDYMTGSIIQVDGGLRM
jgi:NAD(P)-dependent dehydrogenase (short-subunit alcohol dehydrogenase family)/uncharacterized OB-fold protein